MLMMELLWREEEEQEDGALEVMVLDEEEEPCKEESEYLGSGGKLLCAMEKGCLLFRDIIIMFAGVRASASRF